MVSLSEIGIPKESFLIAASLESAKSEGSASEGAASGCKRRFQLGTFVRTDGFAMITSLPRPPDMAETDMAEAAPKG